MTACTPCTRAITNAGITAETSPEDACEMLIAAMQELDITGVTAK